MQVVHSSRRGSRDIEHIGSAHDDAALEALKAVARQRLAAGQPELDLGLDLAALRVGGAASVHVEGGGARAAGLHLVTGGGLYPTITVPVSVWLLMGFLTTVPRDIDEQATWTGTAGSAFWRAVVPLAFPDVMAVAVFAFTLTASEYIYARSFVSRDREGHLHPGSRPS